MTRLEVRELRSEAAEPLPQFLESPLSDFGLMAAFQAQSPYEQDALLEWIVSAESSEARDERIAEMLDQLDISTRGLEK
jgi:hypothetical protein